MVLVNKLRKDAHAGVLKEGEMAVFRQAMNFLEETTSVVLHI
jgi:hypothetical protein